MIEYEALVRSFAHRNLRHIPRYASLSSWGEAIECLPNFVVQHEGMPIGYYAYVAERISEQIVFTTKAMYVKELHSWKIIPYSDMGEVKFPYPGEGPRSLPILMKNGELKNIAISGGEGNIRDLYLVGTFLKRVIELLPPHGDTQT